MTNYQLYLPLTFRYDQTRTLVTFDDTNSDAVDCFKMNDYPLLFSVSVYSVRDENNCIVEGNTRQFGWSLFY